VTVYNLVTKCHCTCFNQDQKYPLEMDLGLRMVDVTKHLSMCPKPRPSLTSTIVICDLTLRSSPNCSVAVSLSGRWEHRGT
jgi:hypothetical protein